MKIIHFGGSRYTSLIQNLGTAYPFTFQYGLQDLDWITGTLVLEKVDREALTFLSMPLSTM